MANIAPSILFVRNLRTIIGQGTSMNDAMMSLCTRPQNDFEIKMAIWWAQKRLGKEGQALLDTDFQRTCLELIEMGLQGAPVFQALEILEKEMKMEFERQWKAYLESLPARLSIPLLFLFFPAYVVLLFGPLVMQYSQGFN